MFYFYGKNLKYLVRMRRIHEEFTQNPHKTLHVTVVFLDFLGCLIDVA